MPRRRPPPAVPVLLAAVLACAALPGLAAPARAASCSGWTSHTEPPPTIRVFRHVSGAVDTVDFATYAKNVLSREWIGSWTMASLRSGALAVKSYAWYQVLHWRGGVNEAGECFDLRDDTYDQVYDPSQATWSTAAAAVDATWDWRVLKAGAIFATYYNAGAVNEACGANANGWKLWQWGTQACGLDGASAAEIISIYYYPNVVVDTGDGALPPPSASPTPTTTAGPSQTPSPSPDATPGASQGMTPTPMPTATPATAPPPTPEPTATPVPTTEPTPMPTALPTPPPDQASPGGGQSGVIGAATPPPAPPAEPVPDVAVAAPATPLLFARLDPWQRTAVAMRRILEWDEKDPGWGPMRGYAYVGAVVREPSPVGGSIGASLARALAWRAIRPTLRPGL